VGIEFFHLPIKASVDHHPRVLRLCRGTLGRRRFFRIAVVVWQDLHDRTDSFEREANMFLADLKE
jgi:hypothetical protein